MTFRVSCIPRLLSLAFGRVEWNPFFREKNKKEETETAPEGRAAVG